MSGGVAAALDEALDGVELPDGDELVQAALFGDDLVDLGSLDQPSPLSLAIKPRQRTRGRTPGSRNRRTLAVAEWLGRIGRHPLAAMVEAYSMPTVQFLSAAGFQPDAGGDPKAGVPHDRFSNDLIMEALKLQYRMAEAVAPYVAQRQPQAVQLQGKAGLTVQFSGVSLPARGGGGWEFWRCDRGAGGASALPVGR